MDYFNDEKNARAYIRMAEGYDGRDLIPILERVLPEGATILELGMGPGVDLDILSKRYRVTGSDGAQPFLDFYREAHPDADLLKLDAVTLDTDRTFDALFSNKVLIHLLPDQLEASIARQPSLLSEPGYVFHTFWRGEGIENHHGVTSVYWSEEGLRQVFEPLFEIIDMQVYDELVRKDSIWLLARKRAAT